MTRTFAEVNAYSDSRGDWQTSPIALNVPSGAKKLKFDITAVQNIGNNKSEPTIITVSPLMVAATLAPPIANVVLAPMLTITAPKDGGKVAAQDNQLVVEGIATVAEAVDIDLLMHVHTERGNFFTGKQKEVRQVRRSVHDVPVNNGKWRASVDISTNDSNITKVVLPGSAWVFTTKLRGRIEIKTATVEVDCRLEVLDVPISPGALLDGLNGGVDALADGVRDAVRVVGEDVVQVALDHLGNLEDSRHARPHRPGVPARMEGLCGLARATVPEVAQ